MESKSPVQQPIVVLLGVIAALLLLIVVLLLRPAPTAPVATEPSSAPLPSPTAAPSPEASPAQDPEEVRLLQKAVREKELADEERQRGEAAALDAKMADARGDLHGAMARNQTAIQHMEMSLDHLVAHSNAMMEVADYYLSTGQREKAAEMLQKVHLDGGRNASKAREKLRELGILPEPSRR